MALALIVLAGFLLAGIARLSLDAALDSMKARDDLQLRWGVISCQRLFLDHADEMFARLQAAGSEMPRPVAAAAAAPVEITLGKTKFRLRLADENCKTNLNTVFAWHGEENVLRVCRDSASSLRAELRPLGEDEGGVRAFDCWSQVFAPADPETGETPPGLLEEDTLSVTCWGDGRVNVLRAPDEVVRTVGRLAVGDKAMRGILALRRQYPDKGLREWVKGVDIAAADQQKLLRLFAEESMCFSLWIEAVTNGHGRETGPNNAGRKTGANGPRRQWNELMVVEASEDDADRISRFVW